MHYVSLMIRLRYRGNLLDIIGHTRRAFEKSPEIKDFELSVDFIDRTLLIEMYIESDYEGSAIDEAILAARAAIQRVRTRRLGWTKSLPLAGDFVAAARRTDMSHFQSCGEANSPRRPLLDVAGRKSSALD
ncbi:hypothetical protein LQL77_30140 [Rhodococcus cerastii]|nr:hypothetical protein [Rhodococcus cerastii]